MKAFRTIALACLLSGSVLAHTAAAELEPRVRALEAALGRLGMPFEAPTAIELLSAGDYQTLTQTELERLHGATWVDVQAQLRQALGIDARAARATSLAALARGSLGSFGALYRSDTGKLAVDGSRADALSDQELLRALVFAWRDRTIGLAKLLGEPRTSESLALRLALLRGEGELAALRLSEDRAGREARTLDPRQLEEPLAKGLGDELTRLLHRSGRDFALGRLQSFDTRGLLALYDEAPASTEQLAHAEKLYRDVPRQIALPSWAPELGLTVVRDDVLGELSILALLREAGADHAQARLAAIGWDGDRLQLLRTPSGESAMVWRVAFDRPEDVAQFFTTFRAHALGQVHPRGFVVDWVRSDSVALAQSLVNALGEFKAGLKHVPEDQASTEAIERELQDAVDLRSRLDGSLWVLPRFDLCLPAPEGWRVELNGGLPFLMGPQIGTFRDNLSVVAIEAERGLNIEALLEQQKNLLAAQRELKLELAEIRTVGGREVGYLRYAGQVGEHELAFSGLLYLLEGRPILVTATLAKANLERIGPMIERSFAGVRFGPVRPTGPESER